MKLVCIKRDSFEGQSVIPGTSYDVSFYPFSSNYVRIENYYIFLRNCFVTEEQYAKIKHNSNFNKMVDKLLE